MGFAMLSTYARDFGQRFDANHTIMSTRFNWAARAANRIQFDPSRSEPIRLLASTISTDVRIWPSTDWPEAEASLLPSVSDSEIDTQRAAAAEAKSKPKVTQKPIPKALAWRATELAC